MIGGQVSLVIQAAVGRSSWEQSRFGGPDYGLVSWLSKKRVRSLFRFER
jgi:hypothetical protein